MLATLTYHAVPTAITEVTAYEWRAGVRPTRVPLTIARGGAGVTIAFEVRGMAVVVFARADGTYVIDGPLARRDVAVDRTLDAVWRHTVRGSAESEIAVPDLAWVTAAGANADAWPRCWWTAPREWECMGVPVHATGLVVSHADLVASALVTPGSFPVLRSSRWARLLVVSSHSGEEPGRLRVAAGRPITATAQRVRGIRVETAAVAGVKAQRLGAGLLWISGDSSPPDAWAEVRGTNVGPVYLRLDELAAGSPLVPMRVALENSWAVEARTMTGAGPAGGALLTMYRLIDPRPQPNSREPPPRRVFVAEAVAAADGLARIDGLGEADYEIVAWHPRFGRGETMLPVGRDRVTIHLLSPGMARGRVLAGGKPLANVDVVSVPDPSAYAGAVDPLDVKGGDGRTGADGRFSVTLAPGGGGELRIGGGRYAVRRVPLPRTPMPLVEIGDIELAGAITVSIALDSESACDLRAAGPIGRTGLQIVSGTPTGPGLFALAVPEAGAWEVVLACGSGEQALAPSVVTIDAGDEGRQIAVRIR